MRSKAIPLGFVVILLLAACSAEVNGVPEPRSPAENSVDVGRTLIASYGCGSCHYIPGVQGADAMAAPPLDQFYKRSYIAGRLPNTEENLICWIQDPQGIEPGNAMPDLGISQAEARDIAAFLYEYHPPTLGDLLRR